MDNIMIFKHLRHAFVLTIEVDGGAEHGAGSVVLAPAHHAVVAAAAGHAYNKHYYHQAGLYAFKCGACPATIVGFMPSNVAGIFTR